MEGYKENTKLKLQLDSAYRVNFASAQNNIPVIKNLILVNEDDEPIPNLEVFLRIDPPVIAPKHWKFDLLLPGRREVQDLDTPLDIEHLRRLNEAEIGTITISASKNGVILVEEQHRIELLAKDEWGGLQEMAQLIAAYVSPNDQAISEILKNASNLLLQDGHKHSLEGYQSGDPKRAWMIAASIWSAITKMGLTYTNAPASFEREGQKIRGPIQIRDEGLATCLDTALLFAGAWEAAGLNSAILFSEGHAFSGFWIVPKDFGKVTESDPVTIRKAIQALEFFCVETTLVTQKPAVQFDIALEAGRGHVREQHEDEFELAIDLPRARSAKIRPLASHQPHTEAGTSSADMLPAELPKPGDLGLLPKQSFDLKPDNPNGRIERWQSKLLDLSLRNHLLNFRSTKQSVPCKVPSIGTLEDELADGRKFKLFPLFEDHPIGERRVTAEEKEEIIGSAVNHAFDKRQISILLDKREMEKRLVNIHRKAKSDLLEGGTNTLYIAAGFLRWQREADKKICRAPLLLVPIKLSRSSVRSPFKIEHYGDEVRFNLTLLEFLKQDFGLLLPDLAGELPRDKSGINLPMIFDYLRSKVRDIRGFEVIEEVEISTFSFAKYLMWKDLVDRTDQLKNNRLVAHLIDNHEVEFKDSLQQSLTPSDLDKQVIPRDIFTPLLADSSQLTAILDSVNGRNFLLIGPPGTGKSQTIANLICQCLAKGKTVLFVAEKSAALNVVHRRLKAYGLNEAILELHSNKTDRRRVLDQLVRNWNRTVSHDSKKWKSVNKGLARVRDQLNTYISQLHEKGTQGFSVFEAIGWVTSTTSDLQLNFDHKDCHDVKTFQFLEETVIRLGQTFSVISDGPQLAIINGTDWSHDWQNKLVKAAQQLRENLQKQKKVAEKLSDFLGLVSDSEVSPERRKHLDFFSDRVAVGAQDLSQVPDLSHTQLVEYVSQLRSDLNEIEKQKQSLNAHFPEDQINRMPLDRIDVDWRSANATFWPLSALRRRKVRKFMQTYVIDGDTSPEEDIPILIQLKNRRSSFKNNPVQHLLGKSKSIEQVERIIEQANLFRKALKNCQLSVSDPARFDSVTKELEGIPTGNIKRFLQEWTVINDTTHESAQEFAEMGGAESIHYSCSDMISNIENLLSNTNKILDWTKWCKVRKEAEVSGLRSLVDSMVAGNLGSNLTHEFKQAYARWWLPLALDASSELRTFSHWEHEELITKFCNTDEKISKLVPAEIMRLIQHDLPSSVDVTRKSELGILRHQQGLKRPSMAIRPLLEKLGPIFPKLAPCVLMSPLSIAQYLPADQANFDVVIFDEASQITTWDAIGAVARGKQSIIVGDPQQLPPTNFFGRVQEEDESDEDNLMSDMPSILDEVKAAGISAHHLNWHYRSRDETLISFSNHNYYGGNLVTFPAASTDSNALKFHTINGIYKRGHGRINLAEANAIAEMIRCRLSASLECPEKERLTLGVITFNAQQQTLILNLLEEMRGRNPELEWFFSEDREEPVIVKNLENIQGDERDVIMFSITFGPDSHGKLSLNFGAINMEGGEKRLNVAITRARKELHVFSSINHQQIDISKTQSKGVHDLKKFLFFAENGDNVDYLSPSNSDSLGSVDFSLENAIADAFRDKGWEVRTQIGNSDFRIDIGIVHPDRTSSYLAGIECDGLAYYNSATVRDRDLIRQSVLKNLGWDLYRIWAIDWFRDPDSVIKRIHDQLEKKLESDRGKHILEDLQGNSP